MDALVPQLVEAHRREAQRHAEGLDRQVALEETQVLPAGGQHQVGLRQHVWHQAEVGGFDHHVALVAVLLQIGVDHAVVAGQGGRGRHVRQAQVVVQGHVVGAGALGVGAVGAHGADDGVFEQRRQVQVLGRRVPVGDQEVEVAVGQHADRVDLGAQAVDDDAAFRRLASQSRHNVGQKLDVEIIRRADAEDAAFVHRGERGLVQKQLADLVEDALGGLFQALAVLRRHHAATAAHQQRVACQLAQLAQRGGNGRLRLVQFERDAGDVFLAQQQVQNADQVDVEVVGELGHGGVYSVVSIFNIRRFQ